MCVLERFTASELCCSSTRHDKIDRISLQSTSTTHFATTVSCHYLTLQAFTCSLVCQHNTVATFVRQYKPSSFDDVEDIEDYIPGGLHPTHIGDTIIDRYKVLHKLGYGGFSTVWLANDTQSHRIVALKILRAEESKILTELEILEKLENGPSDQPGKIHIASLLSKFNFDGPNGHHLCLVSEVPGSSITTINNCPGKQAGNNRLRADISRKVARQIVEALSFIHSQGLCHGDVTSSNILLKANSIGMWSEKEIYQRFREPEKDIVVGVDGQSAPGESAPRYLVEPARFSDAEFLAEEMLLIDFGEAFPSEKPPAKESIGIPLGYCAPKAIFDGRVGIHSDIWALGCVLFEIRAGAQLFEEWYGTEDEILKQIVQVIGRMPDPWWEKWAPRAKYFQDDGKPIEGEAEAWPFERLIANIGLEDEADNEKRALEKLLEPSGTRVPLREAALFEDLLQGIFKWNPEERLSLAEIQRHPWLSSSENQEARSIDDE